MREADLVKRMMRLRVEYDDVIGKIIWRIERRKKVRPFLRRKEDWLQKKILRIKARLAVLNPKKWAFGYKKNKTISSSGKYSEKTYNISGENGFVICRDCQCLFRLFATRADIHCFDKCFEHSQLKPCGVLEQTHDFNWDHRSPILTEQGHRLGLDRIYR